MGMTIDEAITWLNTDDYESKGFADATSIAIETMCKYQQIEEIVKQYKKFGNIDFSVQIISGVIEDGNDD